MEINPTDGKSCLPQIALPRIINFILPQIPQIHTDLFLRTTHPLICKQLLPKQQKICENPCNLWENKKIIRMANSLYSFNSCSKKHYPHGKSVFIREIRGRIK